MICLGHNKETGVNCDNENFLPGVRIVKQYYCKEPLLKVVEGNKIIKRYPKQLLLRVKTPVMICTHCGWYTVGQDQIDELVRRTKKEYDLRTKAKKSNRQA